MADEQDRPDEPHKATPPNAEPSASGPMPPAKKSAKKAAKKAPAKPTKATKAPAKKAAKKAPPPPPSPAPEPPASPEPVAAPTLAETNGETPYGAADETAAHARRAVDTAGDTLARGIGRVPGPDARVPIAVALVMALLAILIIRRLLSDD